MHWDTISGLSNCPVDLHLPPLVIRTIELNVAVTGDVPRESWLLVVVSVGDVVVAVVVNVVAVVMLVVVVVVVVVVFSGVQSPADVPLLPADGMSLRDAFRPASAG